MAFVDSRKRKLAEDGAQLIAKPQKRHRSDHTPTLAIDDQAQLRNGRTGEKVDIASVTKVPRVNKNAKQQRASTQVSRSSADSALAVRPAKAGPSKKTAQKHKVSSSGISSSDEGNTSVADLAGTDADRKSNVALVAASMSPSEEASEAEEDDFGEDEDEDEDEEEDEQDDEEVDSKPLDPITRAQRPKKKARLEKNRHSSDPESDTRSESSTEWASDAMLDSDGASHPDRTRKGTIKADDPKAFASSMSTILGSNLTRTQRMNPILARSADAKEADAALLDRKLGKRARAEMRREKGDKGGWQPDVIFGERMGGTVGADTEEVMGPYAAYQQREKDLRKMAQRGVVKMFNAFAHVREKAGEAQGVVGSRAKKEERATEMSKEGWLEYVGLGGKSKVEEKGQLEKKGKGEQS